MNDMINYLTTKNRLLVAILAFILPFSFARAEAKKDGKTISQGWYIGIEGGMGSNNIVVFLTICISYTNNCFTL